MFRMSARSSAKASTLSLNSQDRVQRAADDEVVQMRDAAIVGIVGDEDVAGLDLAGLKADSVKAVFWSG